MAAAAAGPEDQPEVTPLDLDAYYRRMGIALAFEITIAFWMLVLTILLT